MIHFFLLKPVLLEILNNFQTTWICKNADVYPAEPAKMQQTLEVPGYNFVKSFVISWVSALAWWEQLLRRQVHALHGSIK